MDNEDELEALRRKKLLEMQGNLAEQKQADEQQKAQEAERAKRAQILRQILAPDARERLSNVRLVRPDMAENVENQLIQLASMGRINRLLTDSDIKDILARLTETKRETKIERR
ncbi:MAG: DNA-binding protein [Candidatus Thermoplasmatota archaeon]|jgi:programmed cell death protein 5|nr:DNA-binding protein [Candidatus Thermoplasmatota archaeon]MCL5954697.1 DNA-binding protein [Candidatus Thermoplasmatota archaeon]